MSLRYVIGLDFGTDSVRAVLVDTTDGSEAASDVFFYPRWAKQLYCKPEANQFRQHPLDHLEGLETSVRNILAKGPEGCEKEVAAISVDTTGSTPAALDKDGRVLSLREDFADNPNAMFVLWKDHTAVAEAEHLNHTARTWGGTDFTRYVGGVYSSEWFYAKMLHILREDAGVREQGFTWVEHCDWVPAVLTGTTAPDRLKRGVCAAGHKALWHESWGGLPEQAFFTALDPLLSGLRDRLFDRTWTSDQAAGGLCGEWADRLGLPENLPVGIGAFDAHMGAVGGGITPYSFVRVIGTSTCDMLIAPPEDLGDTVIRGICGQVNGSVVPNMIGMEAGQSAYGDIYAWFKNLLAWPLELALKGNNGLDREQYESLCQSILPALSTAAEAISPEESDIIALDWLNGRRTPDADQTLKGAIAGLSLASDAPRLFRALVEATAFGGKAIVDRFISEGVPIKDVVAIGGVARKSPFAMQVLADVLDKEIKVARSEQTVALGAAMFAAVVGGVYPDINRAQQQMGCGIETVYQPDASRAAHYRERYERYLQLGAFMENTSG